MFLVMLSWRIGLILISPLVTVCAEASAGEPLPNGIRLDSDEVAIVKRLADLSAGDEEAYTGEMDQLLEQLKRLSHGVFHRLVEKLLRAYFTKWFDDLPCKYQITYGRISIEVTAGADLADGIEVDWDGAYGCLAPEDVVVPVPHED